MSLSLLIKPASGSCNMHCKYCFYTDEMCHRDTPFLGQMSFETLDILIDKILLSPHRNISLVFQGGEPTLSGLDFFIHLTNLINSSPRDFNFNIAFQTNGLNLNRDWAKWFASNNVLVGVSLDGPSYIHDKYRLDGNNQGTFLRILDNINLLKEEGVDFNVLSVITKSSAKKAESIYRFFKQNNLNYQQYIECLDPLDGDSNNYSLTPKGYSRFLRDLFSQWYKDIKSGNHIYNRYFENLMMIINGQKPEACNMQGHCSIQWVIEADGSVYPCDFYVLDQYKLGNIHNNDFDTMDKKRKSIGFIEHSLSVPEKCTHCQLYKYCRNGCFRMRKTPVNSNVPEYIFCESMKDFLPFAIPKLKSLFK